MLIVTGFGPFRGIVENPSSILAPQLSANHHVLSVNYGPVREFSKDPGEGHLLCLGVNAKAVDLRFELYAHNVVSAEPGASGRQHLHRKVVESAPLTLGQTLASPEQLKSLPMALSFTPGDYLCNFLLFSLLYRHPGKKIGFVHVPPFDVVSESDQLVQLRELIRYLELTEGLS